MKKKLAFWGIVLVFVVPSVMRLVHDWSSDEYDHTGMAAMVGGPILILGFAIVVPQLYQRVKWRRIERECRENRERRACA